MGLRDVFGILLIILGGCGVMGGLGDIHILRSVATTFGVSPMPGPYSRFAHEPPEKPAVTLECEDAAGKPKQVGWNYLFRDSIPGPHRREVVLLNVIIRLSGSKPPAFGLAAYRSILRYYFCKGGPMAEVMGCSSDTRLVTLHFTSRPSQPEQVSCDPL